MSQQLPAWSGSNPYGQIQLPGPPRPVKRRMPVWAILLIVAVSVGGLVVVLVCGGLIWLGAKTPPPHAMPGRDVPSEYVDQIRDLGLLEPDEFIIFFYSDGMFDITEGMYFVTDRNLVTYSDTMPEINSIIALELITSVTPDYSDSFFIDSSLLVETDEEWIEFPVSIERSNDRRFYDALVQQINRRGGDVSDG